MYTQFFGNYLLSNGYITKEQLFTAMKKQLKSHMKLGTLAIHAGYMTASEVDRIVILQTHEDKKFGELAIENGYLTQEQVIELLESQTPDFLLLGQALCDDGVFNNTDLENIIADYRSQNELYELDFSDSMQKNIQNLFDHFLVIAEKPINESGKMYMELLFNNLIRFIGEDFTPLTISECKEFPTTHCTYQKLTGDAGSFIAYLDMDEETAVHFASRYAGEQFSEFDEYVEASMDDFLNLHNGLFAVNMSNDNSQELGLNALEHSIDSILTFEHTAYEFPVLFPFGTIYMIVQFL